MDEIYVTYVDDEHVDNHDYDDTTDDDHDNNNDIYVSGPDPGRTRTGPGLDPDRTRAGLVGAMVPSPGTNEHPIGRTELLVTPIESP